MEKGHTPKSLVIDQNYLEKLTKKWDIQVTSDLKEIIDGIVYLRPPEGKELKHLYEDVRSFICGLASEGGYIIKTSSNWDNRVVPRLLIYPAGNPKTGFYSKERAYLGKLVPCQP
ncbi:MAG: hypothetical protein PHE43_04145 [Candidatus Nanoarchaeia archaeon]|nr:hypothetical protein [Candidatus Nanoarchaeia archaeon]